MYRMNTKRERINQAFFAALEDLVVLSQPDSRKAVPIPVAGGDKGVGSTESATAVGGSGVFQP